MTDAPLSVDPELRERAKSAWGFGIAAMGLAMVSPCGSYLTLLAALPLGLVAMNRAKVLLEGPHQLDEATEVYARTARLTGLLAAIWSAILIAMGIALVLLYAAMFAAIFAISPPPTPPPSP